MPTTNFSSGGTQKKTFDELLCSPSFVGGLQSASVSFAAVNTLLSITTFLGNSLILVALNKESPLHPASKFLYRCLATTDLLVGLAAQPLYVTYWMSMVHEHGSLCHYAAETDIITSSVLCGVSLLTMTAISVDRLLALLLGLRYKEIALVVCYTPFFIVGIVVTVGKTYSSHLSVAFAMATILVYFNSTLNPFLYCWKISEVRRAMKQTIRQALCCPWS